MIRMFCVCYLIRLEATSLHLIFGEQALVLHPDADPPLVLV